MNSSLIVNSTFVPGISQYLYNMKIRVIGGHTYPADLIFILTGPTGDFIVLVDQLQSAPYNFNITVCSFFLL